MKKLLLLLLPFALVFTLSAEAQTLAEIAAQTRARQKANPNAKIIDNDLLPSASDAASYGSPYETKKDEGTAKKETAKADDKTKTEEKAKGDEKKDTEKKEEARKDEEKTPGAEGKEKASDTFKKKIEDQQKEVAQLQRELDIAQREARLRAAAYYADAGTMLRDQGKFAEDSRKLQGEIDAKTQALTNARQKLEDLQEQARKSGVLTSEIENR